MTRSLFFGALILVAGLMLADTFLYWSDPVRQQLWRDLDAQTEGRQIH